MKRSTIVVTIVFGFLVGVLYVTHVTSDRHDLDKGWKIAPSVTHKVVVPVAPDGPGSECGNREVRAVAAQLNREHALKTIACHKLVTW